MGDKIAAALKAAAGTPSFQAAAHNPAIAGVKPNSDFLAALQAQQQGKSSSFFSGVLNDSSVIDRLAKPFGDPFKIGFSQSMDTVFLVGACVVVVAVVDAGLPAAHRAARHLAARRSSRPTRQPGRPAGAGTVRRPAR